MESTAFGRLHVAALWLNISNPFLLNGCHGLDNYIRQQVTHVEALQLFIHDMTQNVLLKYNPLRNNIIINCVDAPDSWINFQISFAIIANNKITLIVSDQQMSNFVTSQSKLDHNIASLITLTTVANVNENITYLYKSNSNIFDKLLKTCIDNYNNNNHDRMIETQLFASILPSFLQLVEKDVQGLDYLKSNYNPVISCLSDEFDYIPHELRERIVNDRTKYLLYQSKEHSKYYKDKISESLQLCDMKPLHGAELLQFVPPYGEGIVTDRHFSIAFASGGTTGNMKYVYRTEWEDKENARYLGKGLMANGITCDDRVLNTLSSGFWGGMWVFNLALLSTGCSVIPIGSAAAFEQVIDFIDKMKPTAMLCMPSWALSFAEHLNRCNKKLNICKLITGGEMLFPAAKQVIQDSFGVIHFLSTGYTSNETGAIGFQCPFLTNSTFHLHENMQLIEIILYEQDDIISSNSKNQRNVIQVEDGNEGLIIATNLNRTLMPMIRYEIGDRGRIIPYQQFSCPCGRTLKTLELLGRSDNCIRIGGGDVFVEEIASTISKIEELSQLFSIHIMKSERLRDMMHIHVESKHELSTRSDFDELKIIISNKFLIQLKTYNPFIHWDEEYGTMEVPSIIIYSPNTLPKNPRTGKISVVNDHRKII
eukprot:gene5485-7594_t